MGAQVQGRTCRCSSVPSSSSSSSDTPPDGSAVALLPELRQSGLLLGLAFAVVGLALVLAHLLTALQ